MRIFHATVVVECDTLEQAEAVLAERISPIEDYGFDYTLYIRDDGVEEV